jgi:hypothetical protein
MPNNISVTFDFEQVSLCAFRDSARKLHEPFIFADGRAHIEYSRTYQEWEIAGIEIDQGSGSRMRLDEKSPLYPLVVKALEELQSEQIWDAVKEALAEERDNAAEYAAETRRDLAMMERV